MKGRGGFILIQFLLTLPIILVISSALGFVFLWNDFKNEAIELCVLDRLQNLGKLNSKKIQIPLDSGEWRKNKSGFHRIMFNGVFKFIAEINTESEFTNRLILNAESKNMFEDFELMEVWNCNILIDTNSEKKIYLIETVKSSSKLWLPRL